MLSMVEYVHQRLLTYKGQVVVDFTMGNGNDTYFLANHFENVFAFDIQEEAIMNTKKKLKDYQNVTYILDDHKNMNWYLSSFDIGVFNLGFLPRSQSSVTTCLSSTKEAIIKAIDMMNRVLFVVVYPGHKEGSYESEWIDQYVKTLDTHEFNVSCYRMLNKNQSPYVIEIERRKKSSKC